MHGARHPQLPEIKILTSKCRTNLSVQNIFNSFAESLFSLSEVYYFYVTLLGV